MKNFEVDNFTAIIPGTCNADCGFYPEKESTQTDRITWLYNLVDNINRTTHLGYDHVSLSGGEPTLDQRMLSVVIRMITNMTHIDGVGMTTNGQFLESAGKTRNLIEMLNNGAGRNVYFINISRHAFDTAENNQIMRVNYHHTLAEIAAFRGACEYVSSFRLNMVITPTTDYRKLFRETKALVGWLSKNNITIAFRCDYAFKTGASIPVEIYDAFVGEFGSCTQLGGCPTCVSFGPDAGRYHGMLSLKSADFEPMDKDDTIREFIQHMDGELYIDWTRERKHDFNDDPVFTAKWINFPARAAEMLDYRDPMDLVVNSHDFTRPLPAVKRVVVAPMEPETRRARNSGVCTDHNTGSCGGGCK